MTDIQIPPGIVAATSWGLIVAETAFALMESRSFNDKNGLVNVQYTLMHGALIDKARNDACRNLLKTQGQWILFMDMDMHWEPDAILKLLLTAYGSHPQYDVLGGYANLRSGIGLPTMDTGTGTWESWFPGQGVVEVMRTGAAFLLIKRHVLERIPDPWFALRVPMKPLDAAAEVDNFCHTIFDGANPYRNLPGRPWETMLEAMVKHSSNQSPWVAGEVGEDSSFCDRVKAAGMRIGVQTDIVVKHLVRSAQGPDYHQEQMDKRARELPLLAGHIE